MRTSPCREFYWKFTIHVSIFRSVLLVDILLKTLYHAGCLINSDTKLDDYDNDNDRVMFFVKSLFVTARPHSSSQR